MRMRNITKRNLYGWSFVFIGSFVIIMCGILPILSAIILSTQSGIGLVTEFVGLGNYMRLFNDKEFFIVVKNTFTFLIIQVPLTLFLALLIASLLNKPNLKGKTFYRVAIFLPCVTSLVAYSVIIKSLFTDSGFINHLLMNLNIIAEPIRFFASPFWAKAIIIIALVWRWTGYNMIFYLAYLQNIDSSIYEAAKIDGATPIQEFFKLTIPLLKPIILLTTITSTIGGLQIFDEVQAITVGGPGNATTTISQYIYKLGFAGAPQQGYATTVAFAIVFMVIVLTIIQFKVAGDKNEK